MRWMLKLFRKSKIFKRISNNLEMFTWKKEKTAFRNEDDVLEEEVTRINQLTHKQLIRCGDVMMLEHVIVQNKER